MPWWLLVVLATLAALWVIILLANRKYNLKKRGFTISPGLMMWRTKRGLHFIDRVAGISKRGWRAYGTVAAVVGVFLMVFVFVNLILNIIFMLGRPMEALPGVHLALPGLIPGLTLIAWLVAVGSVLLVHEFSHGFVLRAQGLETKSVGGLLLVAIPGAFVEPNEEQLARAPILKRLRVFAAGSFGNVLFSFLCLAIFLMLLVPKPGVYTYYVHENYPADNHGIVSGMRIYKLDNVPIITLYDFYNFMENKQPGENVLVTFDNRIENITLAEAPENENRGILGLGPPISSISRWNFINPLFAMGTAMAGLMGSSVFHPYVYDALVPWAVIDVLMWMFILNLGIGLFNLLPAVPLDGGYMVQGILERKTSKENARRVSRVLAFFVLALILMNLMPLLGL